MKTKPLYFFLLLLLATGGRATAQGYQSYFGADSTLLNVYIVCTDFDPTISLSINSFDNILINNHIYHRGLTQGYFAGVLEDWFADSDLYFREDITTGRLYRYIPSIDEELLLCDMSLSVGDTFSFPTTWGIRQSIVDQISYFNGKKVIYFADDVFYGGGIDDTYRTVFVEGVFPVMFPLGYYDNYMDCFMYLLCEYMNGEQVFDHPYFGSCYLYEYSTNESKSLSTKIYPTFIYPAETINVETAEPILNVCVFDLSGRDIPCLYNKLSLSRWDVTILSNNSGVYIIKTTTKKGISFEKIFISNH